MKPDKPFRIAGIDPSTQETGLALIGSNPLSIIDWRVCQESVGDWVERSYLIKRDVFAVLGLWKPDFIILEIPQPFMSIRGRRAMEGGTTLKLMFLCGLIASYASPRPSLILPSEWKGNLSKKITQNRIEKKIGYCPPSHNAADAVGIALYWIEKKAKDEKTLSPSKKTPLLA